MRKTTYFTIGTILLWVAALANTAQAKKLTVIFTGDTHASLYHCDCPKAPDGGIARRATLLKQIRKDNPEEVLLLDSGGTLAGSIYDEHTQGETLDKIRTEVYVKAMGLMNYQAMAVGDDEFYLGLDFFRRMREKAGFPFLSANLIDTATGKLLLEPFILKEVQGARIAVIGLTSPAANNLFARQGITQLKVEDPIQHLRQVMAQLKPQKPDVVIVLSHLGEDLSRQILEQVPGIDLLINGHDKQSKEKTSQVGDSLMAHFTFQGRQLGSVEMELDGKNHVISQNPQHIRLSSELADDPQMQPLLDEFTAAEPQAKVAVDLFIMPDCPHGETAKAALAAVIPRLYERVTFNLYYISQDRPATDARYKDYLDEADRLLFISKQAYHKFWPYVKCRKSDLPGATWERCANEVGLNVEITKRALEQVREAKLLEANMAETARLSVTASPTLMINNQLYPGPVTEMALLKYICEQLPKQEGVEACQNLPECTNAQDCYKPGHIGVCQGEGTPQAKCQYTKAEEFPLQIIYDPQAFTRPDDFISYLTRSLPGAQVSKTAADSPEGRELINKYHINRLPAYLLGSEVLKTSQGEGLKEHLLAVEDKLLINPGAAQANVYLDRQPQPGQISLLYPPLAPKSIQVLLNVLSMLEKHKDNPQIKFQVLYLVAKDNQGNLEAPNGEPEVEESLRQLAIYKKYPAKFITYLVEKNKQPYSSYWEQPVTAAGLDSQEIKKLAQSEELRKEMAGQADLLTGLELSAPLNFLINNREIVTLRNRQEFESLIQHMSRNTTPPNVNPQSPSAHE